MQEVFPVFPRQAAELLFGYITSIRRKGGPVGKKEASVVVEDATLPMLFPPRS